MKQFEFKRFALVLWRELATAWKMLAAYAILSILLLIFSEMSLQLDITARENTFYTITIVGAVVLASRVLSNIWSRRRCIATFSLPAAAVETFVARYLLWLAIPLWFAFNMILFREWIELYSWNQASAYYYSFKFDDLWYSWGFTCLLITIVAHLIMLGGAFFNRLVLLKTVIVGIALFIIVASIITKFQIGIAEVTRVLWVLLPITVIGGLALSFIRFNRRTVDVYKR